MSIHSAKDNLIGQNINVFCTDADQENICIFPATLRNDGQRAMTNGGRIHSRRRCSRQRQLKERVAGPASGGRRPGDVSPDIFIKVTQPAIHNNWSERAREPAL